MVTFGEEGEMRAEWRQFRAEVAERKEVKMMEAVLGEIGTMS